MILVTYSLVSAVYGSEIVGEWEVNAIILYLSSCASFYNERRSVRLVSVEVDMTMPLRP